jgi:hypothetical protein
MGRRVLAVSILVLCLCDYVQSWADLMTIQQIPHIIYRLTLSAIACQLSGPVGLS